LPTGTIPSMPGPGCSMRLTDDIIESVLLSAKHDEDRLSFLVPDDSRLGVDIGRFCGWIWNWNCKMNGNGSLKLPAKLR